VIGESKASVQTPSNEIFAEGFFNSVETEHNMNEWQTSQGAQGP